MPPLPCSIKLAISCFVMTAQPPGLSAGTVGPWPVNTPTMVRHGQPEQRLRASSSRVMVQRCGTFIEAACVPGIRESEAFKIKVMAEFMAERAQESSERGDLPSDSRSHPDSDQHRAGVIVTKQFECTPFPDAKRSRREYTHTTCWDPVEL